MITSKTNKKIKDMQALLKKSSYRQETGLFVVEGIRMFREIPMDSIAEIMVSQTFYDKCESKVRERIDKCHHELLADDVYACLSDTKTPQGILATVHMPTYDAEEIIDKKKNPLILMLETIQDPGNLGTILRSCEGAGVSCIIADNKTVDIYNPKVIRSTMGSVFRMPYVISSDMSQSISMLKKRGIRVYAAYLDDKSSIYDRVSYKEGTAFMIGNEAAGLSDELTALADEKIHIPMAGRVESLNASVAASLLVYEAARQRRI